MRRLRAHKFASFFIIMLLIVGMAFALGGHAAAGPEVVGDQQGSDLRMMVGDTGGKVIRITYFSTGAKTMVGANTPVASNMKCGVNGALHSAQVQLVGTMGGTAPTLAVLWQNSKDGGNTWTSIGSWTTVNATVTPATQNQVVSDIYNNSTAVSYGDCWRATYTFGGTGTVTANFSMTGFEK